MDIVKETRKICMNNPTMIQDFLQSMAILSSACFLANAQSFTSLLRENLPPKLVQNFSATFSSVRLPRPDQEEENIENAANKVNEKDQVGDQSSEEEDPEAPDDADVYRTRTQGNTFAG